MLIMAARRGQIQEKVGLASTSEALPAAGQGGTCKQNACARLQVSEARLIELLEQVSDQTEKKTKVGRSHGHEQDVVGVPCCRALCQMGRPLH